MRVRVNACACSEGCCLNHALFGKTCGVYSKCGAILCGAGKERREAVPTVYRYVVPLLGGICEFARLYELEKFFVVLAVKGRLSAQPCQKLVGEVYERISGCYFC